MSDAKVRQLPKTGITHRRWMTGAVAAAAIVGLVTGCSSEPAPTESSGELDPAMAALYEEAKATAGGKISLYTHLSGTDQQIALTRGFKEAFPDLTLEVTGLQGQAVLERLLTEKRAGQNLVDVFEYPGMAPFLNELQDEGFLEPYTPTAAADYTTPGTFIEGLAYPWSSYELAACYNPNNVTAEDLEALESYEGWTDPRFAGRAAIAMPTGGTYLRGWDYWVEQDPNLGADWVKEIKDNVNPVAYANGNNAADRVAAGEHDVVFGVITAFAIRAAAAGAPLECARQEYTVVVPAPMALVTDGPNPAGGKLYIEWQASEAGQRVMMNGVGNLSARDDLFGVAPEGVTDWPVPNELVTSDEAVVADTQDELVALFTSLFGSGQ